MKQSEIFKKHYANSDLTILSKDMGRLDNPYMSDGKEPVELKLEIEIAHKAWLEGAVYMYLLKQGKDDK